MKRMSFGPYKLGTVPELGAVKETKVAPEFKHLMGLFYREKLQFAVETWNKLAKSADDKTPRLPAGKQHGDEEGPKRINPRIVDAI